MIDPATRLRSGVDARRCVEVATKAGAQLLIQPVLVKVRDVLAGTLPSWHLLVLELRNEWARADLMNKAPSLDGVVIAQVCSGAVSASYDADRETFNEWFTEDDHDAVLRVCSAACGRPNGQVGLADVRRRCLAVAMLGMADIPLTAIEVAMVADFAVNSGRAPQGA